jgi:triosephosphate isomerase
MKYIFANWKMHLGVRESVALARGVIRSMRGKDLVPEITLFPSFTALSEVHKALARSRVELGAQNVSIEQSGAYTGEVSSPMLEDIGCTYALIGHSERRNHFGETDEMVHQKMQLLSESKVAPVLCLGEGAAIREAGDQFQFIGQQLQSALAEGAFHDKRPLFLAYEPIWAIGTGEPAPVTEVIEMHAFLRDQAVQLTGKDPSDIKVLYGGSIDEENAYQYLREAEVQGVLVGGASLRLHAFSGIIEAGMDVVQAQAEK